MVIASLQETDNVYRLLVFLHILTVIVGFGSTFVYPLTGTYASKHPGPEAKGISNATILAGQRLTEPAIYTAGVFGLVLVIVGPYGFEESWISASLLIYLGALIFSGFVHQPNLRKMNALVNELSTMGPPPAGDPAGGPPPQVIEMEKRGKDAARNGGILHVAFAVILVLMIWGTRGGF